VKEDKVNKYLKKTELVVPEWVEKITQSNLEEIIMEVSSRFNIGFEEMVRFYNEATPQEIKQMEKVVKRNDWNKFKALIKKVLDVELQ
jgi:hypothetical protein